MVKGLPMLVSGLILIMALPCYSAGVTSFSGAVVGISDGDTIKVTRGNSSTIETIRLMSIDCPEKSQDFGPQAKAFTSQLCLHKTVTVYCHGADRNHGIIGDVVLPAGNHLSPELVKAGLAWWYRKYAPQSVELGNLERQAIEAHRGLWVAASPQAPWECRHAKAKPVQVRNEVSVGPLHKFSNADLLETNP